MDPEEQNRFRDFLIERSRILEDIRQFLNAILLYCLDKEDNWGFQRDVIATKNVYSLIESLCLIHGLYGYPAESNRSSANTGLNKRAVRDMLNEIEEKNKKNEMITFVHYCEEVAVDEFWQFKFSDGTSSLESSLREPAYIFLQMVRDLFGNRNNVSVIGRLVLEGLPDGNLLKPVVWAEHKERQDCYGVSLGVRPFLRPLYLYIKMNQLRNVENCYDGVKLDDVNAFQSMERKSMKYKESKRSKYKKSKDENKLKVKPPCVSCKIFFKGFNKKREKGFSPFGNCAEYDVIRTPNLDYVLGYIEETDDWKDFKSACEEHFKAFNELTKKMEEPGNPSKNEIMKTYFANTRNAKVLIYEWDSLRQGYELVGEDWPPSKTRNSEMMGE